MIFPIRLRLPLLFLFASGLPLGILFLVGWAFLNQKHSAANLDVWNQSERELNNLDRSFPQMRDIQEMRMHQVLSNSHYETTEDKEKLNLYLQGLGKQAGETLLFDRAGKENSTWLLAGDRKRCLIRHCSW